MERVRFQRRALSGPLPRLLMLLSGLAVLVLGRPGMAPALAESQGTITVNTTVDEIADNQDCSLREAIVAANRDEAFGGCPAGSGDDTIALPAGVYTLTIAGAGEDNGLTGDLDIVGDLTIKGAGSRITIIDGGATHPSQPTDRVFHIRGPGSVTIAGVTIRKGDPGFEASGGGVLISSPDAQVVLQNSFITENITQQGGGITNAGVLELINSIVLGNTAARNRGFEGPPPLGNAGGILNSGSLTLIHSTVRGNFTGGDGGGILNTGSLVLHNSAVVDNSAHGRGGGLYNEGELPIPLQRSQVGLATLTLDHSTVSRNTAFDDGGGIYALAATVTLTTSTISGNIAAIGQDEGQGGGLYVDDSTLAVTDSTIADNTASSNGGGLRLQCGADLTMQRSTVSGNTALNGGGLFLGSSNCSGADMVLTNSTVSGNRATDSGGGIHTLVSVTLNNVTVTNNAADTDFNGVGNGGGIATAGGAVHLKNSILAGNVDHTLISFQGIHPDCSGTLTVHGHNLLQDNRGCALQGGAVNVANPRLGPLAANGGPTLTHALLATSPAIGAVSDCTDLAGNLLDVDQRSFGRPSGAGQVTIPPRCDLGAFEFGATGPVGLSELSPRTGISPVGVQATFVLTWTHPVKWRVLDAIDLRLQDTPDTALWARFRERFTEGEGDTSTFSLLDAAGNVVDEGQPGSAATLETETATLYLAESRFQGSGAEGPTVTVTFVVSFKSPAAGRRYSMEVWVRDDEGHVQGPDLAGVWQVGSFVYVPLVTR